VDRAFKYRSITRRLKDLPWITVPMLRKLRKKKKIYRREGRSQRCLTPGPHTRPNRHITSTPITRGITREDSNEPTRFFKFRRRMPFDDTQDTDISIEIEDVDKLIELLKYIDDFNVIEVTDSGQIVLKYSAGAPVKRYRAKQCEKLFLHVEETAKQMGMKVNGAKTQLLSISTSGTSSAYMRMGDSEKIESTSNLKILGFLFGNQPTVNLHVDQMVKKFNRSLWSIVHLKKAKIPEKDLVALYQTYLRPILEYAAPVLCSLMTEGQSNTVENLQMRVLRVIYGHNKSAKELLEASGLQRLKERREEITDKFAMKAAASQRFGEWFKPNENRRSERVGNEYEEKRRQLEKTRKNQIDYMTRRLNEMKKGTAATQ
jgi:hypothetical protein